MKVFRRSLAGLIAITPTTSFADVDFYSYGGFEVTLTGLNYLRTVFNDVTYSILVLAVFSLAGMLTTLIGTTKGLMGKQKGNEVVSSLFLCFLGFTFYQATIIPKTTVHVYDTVLNKYQSVGNIPVFVAYTLGTINTLERMATDAFSTDTLNRDEHGAGSTMHLLNKVLLSNPIKSDSLLTRSIDQYIADCVPPAMASNVDTYGSFSMDDIITGTTSIVAEVLLTASHFQTTTYYDAGNKNGVSLTCSDAWDNISTLLALPATFDDNYAAICEQSGWRNLTAPGFVDCKARITAITEVLLDGPANTIDTDTTAIAANQVLARAFGHMLTEYPTTYMQDMINMKNQVAGLSSLVASENWLPATRYTTMMIILGFLPLLSLMIVTPFLGKALKYMTGLVLFITVWSVGDASIHSITLDLVSDQLYSSRQSQYSVYTFFTAPTQLQEAIATMGRMQSMGLLFATIIMGTFFGIAGHAFSNMGEKLAADIDRVGRDVGETALMPSARTSQIDGYADAATRSGLMSEWGSSNYMRNRGASSTERDYGNNEYFSQMSEYNTHDAMQYRAQVDSGKTAGSVRQTMDIADGRGSSLSQTSSDIGAMSTLNQYQDTAGTHSGRQQVEAQYGYNPETVIAQGVQNQSETTVGVRVGRDLASEQTGYSAPAFSAISELNQTETALGTRDGRDQASNDYGIDPISYIADSEVNHGITASGVKDGRDQFSIDHGIHPQTVVKQGEWLQASNTVGSYAGKKQLEREEGVDPVELAKFATMNSGQDDISMNKARSEFLEQNADSLPADADSITDVLTTTKEAQLAQSTADAGVLDNIQANTDAENIVEAAQMRANSNVSLALSNNDLENMQDQGGTVPDASIFQAQIGGGATANVSFDKDGNAFKVDTNSGSSATENNRIVSQSGVEIPNGGIYDMLENNAAQGVSVYSAALSGKDKATEQSVNRAWVETTYGSMSASDSDQSSASSSVGASASIKPLSLIKSAPKALADLITVYADAKLSGSNTDTDSREISTLGYFSYITDHYQELFEKARTRNEELGILSEYHLMQQTLSDTINSQATALVDDNLDDVITPTNGNSMREEMDRWNDGRESADQPIEANINYDDRGKIIRDENGQVVDSISDEEEDLGRRIPLR